MSVFDMFSSDDPAQASKMALIAGLLGGKGNFNGILSRSMMGAQEAGQSAKQRQQVSELNKRQLEEIQRKAEEQKRQQAQTEAWRASLISPQVEASQAALAGGGGPTMANAANMRPVDPQRQMLYDMARSGVAGPMDFLRGNEGIATREDRQQASRETQDATIQAALTRSREVQAAALERQREGKAADLQRMKELQAFTAANRQPRAEQPLVAIIGPDGKPVLVPRGEAVGKTPASSEKLRTIPTSVNTAFMENKQSLERLDRAITLMSGKNIGDPAKGGRVGDVDATGFKGYLPNFALNRVDPSGTDARAEIADIGSLKIHDRSGAAVTVSESPRLMPFIPLTTDNAATVTKKLRRLKTEIESAGSMLSETYSEEQGYRPNPLATQKPKASVSNW